MLMLGCARVCAYDDVHVNSSDQLQLMPGCVCARVCI